MTARIIPLAEAGRSMILSCYPVVRSCLDKATVVCRGCLGSVSSLCSAPSSKIEKPVVPLSVKPRLQTWHKVAFSVAGLGAAAYLMKSYGFFLAPKAAEDVFQFTSCSGTKEQDAVNCILKNAIKWDVKESSPSFANNRQESFGKFIAQMFPANDCANVHETVVRSMRQNVSAQAQAALRILQSICPISQTADVVPSASLPLQRTGPSSITARTNESDPRESAQQVVGWASPTALLSLLSKDRCSSVELPKGGTGCELINKRREAFLEYCPNAKRADFVAQVFQPLLTEPKFQWLQEEGWSLFNRGWQPESRQEVVYSFCQALLDDCNKTEDLHTSAFVGSHCPVSKEDGKAKLVLDPQSTSTAISLSPYSSQQSLIPEKEVVFVYNFYRAILDSLEQYAHYKYKTKEFNERLAQIMNQLNELQKPYHNVFAQHADVQRQYGTGFVMENFDNPRVAGFLRDGKMERWERLAKERLEAAFNEEEFSLIVGSGLSGLRLPVLGQLSSGSRQMVCSLMNLLFAGITAPNHQGILTSTYLPDITHTPVYQFFKRIEGAVQQHLVKEATLQLGTSSPGFLPGLADRIVQSNPLALGDGSVSDE